MVKMNKKKKEKKKKKKRKEKKQPLSLEEIYRTLHLFPSFPNK